MLKGYRTYVMMALALIAAWASYAVGDTTLGEAVTASFAAIGGMTIRAGVSNEIAKTASKTIAPIFLVAMALGGCATSTQPTDLANRSRTGEGDKDTSAAMFGAVATTRETARLSDRDLPSGGGGETSEPVIVWNADTKTYQSVLGPDGAPLMRSVRGVRNYYNMVGNTITNTATGSGTTTGTTSQGGTQSPTGTPTNTTSPSTDVSGLPK